MVIAAISLTEKPEMDKYTKEDILKDLDPIKTIDSITMGESLVRDGYWSKRFVIYLISSPDNNKTEMRDISLIMKTLEAARPDITKVFWFKKSLVVSYPFMNEEKDALSFIEIKSELIRFTQFLYLEGIEPKKIIEKVRKYSELLISIKKGDK